METPITHAKSQIDGFLEELRVVRQLSPHTIKAYNQDLNVLLTFLQTAQISLEDVKAPQTRSWIAQLHAKGSSPRSLARLLSAWRTFFEWLAIARTDNLNDVVKVNPVQDIRAPRKAKSLPKALSVEYALGLMDQAKNEILQHHQQTDVWIFLRDHALVELFYSSGLRLSEILGIEANLSGGYPNQALGWIDWEQSEVHVLGKGGKRRIVPIGNAALEALKAWYACWTERLKSSDRTIAPLFINQNFMRLSPRTVQERLKKLAIRAGLPIHVHPHMLRHSFASHVLQSSHDLRAVQEMLGHASIGSTQIYTSLDFQHLAQAYDLAHPRAKVRK
jgi:integrase/recombinase XerC